MQSAFGSLGDEPWIGSACSKRTRLPLSGRLWFRASSPPASSDTTSSCKGRRRRWYSTPTAGYDQAILLELRATREYSGGFRCLRGRLRGAPVKQDSLRSLRGQDQAHFGAPDHGCCDVLDRSLTDLQLDRRLGADPARCTSFYPGHRSRWRRR